MPKLHMCQLSEVTLSLPDIGEFDPSQAGFERDADLFVCSLGFEERCLTIPDKLAQNHFKFNRALYFEYSTNRDDNETNRPGLLQSLEEISERHQSLESDDQSFSHNLRNHIESTIRECRADDQEPIVIFDISSAKNRLVMRAMKVLFEFNVNLKILYSEAAQYHPTPEEYEKDPYKWAAEDSLGLERGVSNVVISEEYPGYHVDQLPDCVIIFPSFKKERAHAVISEVDPSLLLEPDDMVIWLLGIPHHEQDHWRVDAMRKINELDSNNLQYDVSTFAYKESLTTLETIFQEKEGRCRFTLTPMGSKMQALGAALFCYLRPEVRVIFATPTEYNAARFSQGCKATWSIDFGSLKKIRGLLDQVGNLSIEE